MIRIYTQQPPDKILINNQFYQPIFFVKTKGRSNTIHYIVDYVKDCNYVYYVKMNEKNDIKLIPLKSANLNSFKAISWEIAKDEKNVYLKAVKKKVYNVQGFDIVNEEIELYSDGEQYYNNELKALAIDKNTFSLIPLTQGSKHTNWSLYNEYLIEVGLNELPFECAMQYLSRYFIDKYHLYYNNSGWIRPIRNEEIRDTLEKEKDIQYFISQKPAIKEYEWYKYAFECK